MKLQSQSHNFILFDLTFGVGNDVREVTSHAKGLSSFNGRSLKNSNEINELCHIGDSVNNMTTNIQ